MIKVTNISKQVIGLIFELGVQRNLFVGQSILIERQTSQIENLSDPSRNILYVEEVED